MKPYSKLHLCLIGCCLANSLATHLHAQQENPLRVMTWNIWHGGREDGAESGPQRVVDVIRESAADVVAMQETYGSGEWISQQLGFHFHPRGTNVSIHSRFPVIEDLSVFEEFKCVGALLQLPDERRLAFFSIWLPYNTEIWAEGTRDVNDPQSMKQACQASADDLQKIWTGIKQRLDDPAYDHVPIIIAGDFNSMSHLDYRPSFQDQFGGLVIDWPTSHVLIDNGFRDAWRELHPEVNRLSDRTWSPRFPQQQQDRIDYIYYRGPGLAARESWIIDTHREQFPSDHAGFVSQFDWPPQPPSQDRVRVASYNIRHAQGTDGRRDLDRTAALLQNLRADIIGLQEVDQGTHRSDREDQPALLGEKLGMASAFGCFMGYQGGKYGLAILSRFPIEATKSIRLPPGNEPRVALACRIRLPSGQPIMVVNLHLDWVRDDSFRRVQAEKLAEYLAELQIPYLLLGDFNDQPDSPTLQVLSRDALPATKPAEDRFTFSSTDPQREIDFIFAAPRKAWSLHDCRLFDAPLTSDHRPVLAELTPLK